MRYKLVDKYDNVVNTVDLASNVGVSGARTYFLGVKKIDEESFDKLWKVMTEQEWNRQFKMGHRPPSHRGIEWWHEEKEISDDELKF